ncbi:hypothetical protein KIPB_010297 [Kipferlia bialata]|uniref:DNA replication licensing factor MCM2-like winged-helix domain-containing protein n=1 Tax=Kipferlia bialata TaxID=797122 RepID=A0A9K3GMR4_9EUKA|nr:hypothetical protein KIPB_010297 [Kipferlia bialata]|eukprot:g10297.t1
MMILQDAVRHQVMFDGMTNNATDEDGVRMPGGAQPVRKVEVAMRDFRIRCADRGVQNPDTLFESDLFRNSGFTVDRENDLLVREFDMATEPVEEPHDTIME